MACVRLDCEVYKRGKRAANTVKQREAIRNCELLGIDLLVREMLQNSLDAALDDNSQKAVSVYFRETVLNVEEFAAALGGDKASGVDYAATLLRYVKEHKCKRRCFSIRDVGCVGMDGDVADQESRAWKLPFGFLDGQDSSSATGGANGVGKVVAFKFGIGFVAYYSRTKDGRSRFVIAFMDDGVRQVFPRSMLPEGAAWWGRRQSSSSSEVLCIEDEVVIAKLLQPFGIAPYSGNKSGTTVIIPFFDSDEVLRDIREMFPVETCPWSESLPSYLKFCTRQWYSPRLRQDGVDLDPEKLGSSSPYHWGRSLKVHCSGGTESPAATKVFDLIRELYDVAVGDELPIGDVIRIPCPLHRGVSKKRAEFSGETIGWVAVKKINFLKGKYKDVRPVLCALVPGRSDDEGGAESFSSRLSNRRGFMLYCRRHGMIITYEREWDDVCYGVLPKPQEGEFYVGVFVVNSDSQLKSPFVGGSEGWVPVDVMFRSFENTDHYRWPRRASFAGVSVIPTLLRDIKAGLAESSRASEAALERQPLERISALLGRFLSPAGDGFGDGPRPAPEGVGGLPDGIGGSLGGGASDARGRGNFGNGGRIGGRSAKIGRVRVQQGCPHYGLVSHRTVVTIPMCLEFPSRNLGVQMVCGIAQDGSGSLLYAKDFPEGGCPVALTEVKMTSWSDGEPPTLQRRDKELSFSVISGRKCQVELDCMFTLLRKDVAIAVDCRTLDSTNDEGAGR